MSRAGITRLIAVLCALLLTLSPALAAEYPGKPKKSTTQAVFMSMALPGAGQIYTENYWRAAAFAVAQGSFIASISWSHDRMEAAKKATPDAFNTEQDLVARERHFRSQRNRNIWWLIGVTMLSMGDAYVGAHLYGLDWSPDISADDGGIRTRLSATVHF